MGDESSILAIDPATNTGWALVKGEDTATFSHGHFKISSRQPLKEYYEQIARLINETKPSIVFIEDYFLNKSQCCGAALNYQLRAVVFLVLQQRDISYVLANPLTWKKCVTGRGRPNIEEVEKWGTKANKEFVRQALLAKGFIHDGGLTADEVDAYGILYYAMNKK